MSEVFPELKRLRAAAAQLDDFAPVSFTAPPSQEEMFAFREAAGGILPYELEEFFAQVDSVIAMDVWNGYWIGGLNHLTRSLHRSDPQIFLEFEGASCRAIPIASDGGGNGFVMVASQDSKVWKYLHETGSIVIVAQSFSHFLSRVADDWEHFLHDDPDWQYLAG